MDKIKIASLIPLKKRYLLEDDSIITEDNEMKGKNKVFSIFDFRFFKNNIQKTPIVILINTENINKNLTKLYGEMQALIISTSESVFILLSYHSIKNFCFSYFFNFNYF